VSTSAAIRAMASASSDGVDEPVTSGSSMQSKVQLPHDTSTIRGVERLRPCRAAVRTLHDPFDPCLRCIETFLAMLPQRLSLFVERDRIVERNVAALEPADHVLERTQRILEAQRRDIWGGFGHGASNDGQPRPGQGRYATDPRAQPGQKGSGDRFHGEMAKFDEKPCDKDCGAQSAHRGTEDGSAIGHAQSEQACLRGAKSLSTEMEIVQPDKSADDEQPQCKRRRARISVAGNRFCESASIIGEVCHAPAPRFVIPKD